MKVKLTSLSAVDRTALGNFIAALAILSAAQRNDVKAHKAEFVKYANASKPFMTRFGLLRTFMATSRNFIKTMTLDDDMKVAYADLLKEHLPAMVEETAIPQTHLALIKDARLIISKDSDAAYRRMTVNISVIKMPAVAAMFTDVKAVGSVKSSADLMRRIVKQLTKRPNDPILTLNEIRELRESNPKLIAQYAEARKVFVDAYKKGLAAFVRSTGKTVVPVKDAHAYLAKIDADYIPKGFEGGIDDKGQLYTTAGKLVKGMLIGEVVMNPKYDAKTDNTYVCYLKAKPTQRLRTAAFMMGNKEKTFEKVSTLANDIESHRKKWLADLTSKDDLTRKLATMVETVFQTQARIGGDGNEAGGEATFGISTIEKRHMKVLPTAITMSYPGKKGTPQHHEIKQKADAASKRLYANLKAYYAAAPTKDSPIFAFGRSNVPAARVNRYLKSLGIDATIHKFRHIKGNAVALEQIKTAPFKKGTVTQSAAEKWYKEAMKAVGEALHHQTGGKVTGMTSITSYISPKISQDFFKNLGLRVPKWVPTKED